jgi:uncharacterized protein YbaA (DUF1428 family)
VPTSLSRWPKQRQRRKTMTYVDGFVIPVPEGKKQAYLEMAEKAAPIFREHGALSVVECWGDDLPEGKVTDFHKAVKAEEGENVVLSWITWPSKQVRDAGNAKAMADERMIMDDNADIPFDMKRIFFGGFETIVEG